MEESKSVFGDTDVLLGLMKNEGFLFFNQTEIDEGVSKSKKASRRRIAGNFNTDLHSQIFHNFNFL